MIVGTLILKMGAAVFGLSAARLHAWRVASATCQLEDQPSCPKTSPQRITPNELLRLRQIVTSDDYRHVPTTRLALLAQRLAQVFVSASTLCRLVRVRGWRRPRLRLYPSLPREGVRASRPNEIWHVDVTILRLLDGTRAYLHAVIDNFSRRILAWRVTDRLLPGGTVAILLEAARSLATGTVPTLFADSGSENVNGKVDALVEARLIKRVLAQTDVLSSNSLIEAFWRSSKHQWLFLNSLDTIARLRSLVAFYVSQHNSVIPHSAFRGETPDEVYFATGAHVRELLATQRRAAREARLASNRAARCAVCTA